MKLSLWVIVSIFILSSAVYWVMSHPNRDKAIAMEEDLMKLKEQNASLDAKNKKLQREILAIQSDPRVVERRAREIAPLVKKNEKIYQIKVDNKVREVEVAVVIKGDTIVVGGNHTTMTDLPILLKKMKTETKEAIFTLSIKDDQIDVGKRKRLKGIINDANAKAVQNKK